MLGTGRILGATGAEDGERSMRTDSATAGTWGWGGRECWSVLERNQSSYHGSSITGREEQGMLQVTVKQSQGTEERGEGRVCTPGLLAGRHLNKMKAGPGT